MPSRNSPPARLICARSVHSPTTEKFKTETLSGGVGERPLCNGGGAGAAHSRDADGHQPPGAGSLTCLSSRLYEAAHAPAARLHPAMPAHQSATPANGIAM